MNTTLSRFVLAAAMLPALSLSPALAATDDGTMRVLTRALEQPASDVRADLLLPLRRLRDPSLRALWGGLASSSRADLRRHGVLGLAELESPPRLTPLLLTRIKDPIEQALILGEAMSSDLLPASEIPAMLRVEGLDTLVEVALRARLEKPAQADLDRLVSIASDGGPAQRVLAAVVLAGKGQKAALAPAVEAFAQQPEPDRGAKAGTLLTIIARENIGAGGPFFSQLATIYGEDRTLLADVLRVWLRTDPSTARPALAKAVANATSPADTARLALAALDAAERLKAEDFDAFPSEDPSNLFTPLVEAGRAIVRKEPEAAVTALARDRSRTEVQLWCVQRSKQWDAQQARAVCRAVVESWVQRGPRSPVGDAAGLASARLAELGDWEWLAALVEAACAARDDKLLVAIYTGLLSGDAVPEWKLPERLEWPDATTSCAAALFAARAPVSAGKAAPDIARLRDIASGLEGRMPMPLRVQAAWLATRAAGDGDAAIARLLSAVQ